MSGLCRVWARGNLDPSGHGRALDACEVDPQVSRPSGSRGIRCGMGAAATPHVAIVGVRYAHKVETVGTWQRGRSHDLFCIP